MKKTNIFALLLLLAAESAGSFANATDTTTDGTTESVTSSTTSTVTYSETVSPPSITLPTTKSVFNPDDKRIDDPYNFDEWQAKPHLLGESLIGFLQPYHMERATIGQLMKLVKKQNEGKQSNVELDLTIQLLRGYFNGLPNYLNSSSGQSSVLGIGQAIQYELEQHVTDNLRNAKQNGERLYMEMSEAEQMEWLTNKISWMRVVVSLLYGQPYEDYKPREVNDRCYKDAVHMLRSFYKQEQWALEMMDSSGRLPTGLFQGNLNWIGQYDQCFKIKSNGSDENFQGSYCDITMEIPPSIAQNMPAPPGQKLTLKMGVCFPSTCHSLDVQYIMGNLSIMGYRLPKVEKARCHKEAPLTEGAFSRDNLAHGAAALLLAIVGMVVVATIIDGFLWYEDSEESEQYVKMNNAKSSNGKVNHAYEDAEKSMQMAEVKANGVYENVEKPKEIQKEESPPKEHGCKIFLQSFSIYTNLPLLLSTKQSRGSIKSLDALRVFNMNWIILGHVYSMGAAFMADTTSNIRMAAEVIKDWTFMGVYSAMFAVDSFFFVSGLLVTYLFLKTSAKNHGKWGLQLAFYYIHRFIRILPFYGVIILVYAAFGKYLGAGPLFDWESARVRDCNNNWWTNLLFINNFVKPREMCLGWSWYLANDMQFYIVAPLILIPLYLKPIVGYIILALFYIAHWASTAYLWAQTKGKSFMQDSDIFYTAYITPYCRIGPYLAGIVLGYVFYKQYKLKNRVVVALLWILTILMMGILVYVQYDDVKKHGVAQNTWTTVQRTLYETFSRDLWGFAIAWIVYACNNGYAGFVGHILNWRGWSPLGRATFAAYLIHPLVLFIYIGNRRDLNYVDNFSVAFLYSGYVILSYVSGAILSLLFEYPPSALDKLVFAPCRKSRSH